MVIEPHNFKILLFQPNGYLIPIFLNIAIPAITDFSPHNFKILSTLHMEFYWIGTPI